MNGETEKREAAPECSWAKMYRMILDEDKPGWTEETFWCRLHYTKHELVRELGQLAMIQPTQDDLHGKTGGRTQAGGGRAYPRGRILEEGMLCFHHGESARGQPIRGACAYCGTSLHVHAVFLGSVRSGRHGASYIEERCPACHRSNAVYPLEKRIRTPKKLKGIRTAQMLNGAPMLRMKLIGGR